MVSLTPKMISAAKTNKSRPGFSLIEIVMVLAIIAVIMGGAIGLMVYSSGERTLRRASGEIELLAKRARTIAILHQTSYALEFREGVVRLLPLAQAGQDLKKDLNRRHIGADHESEASPEDRVLDLQANLTLSIRRWNSDAWLPVAKNAVQVWRFDPEGLCEPISIRLTLGDSWSEDKYHPLTAAISESQIEAR